MINNSNNKQNPNDNKKDALGKFLEQNGEIGNEIKNLINSLSPEDIKKISGLMKNQDVQKLASSIIDSKKQKG